MAKVRCPNCGHKNKSSASICANCGNFLLDSQFSMQATENNEPVVSPQAYDTHGIVEPVTNRSSDVIKVQSKKGIYSW
ncbi:MAG: zinc ribbon domain-containing protein, partial [Candidatus Thermoplasmatota archaeon]|nr:zinc ribbon domain-containing protein [Candidatus Thermoplasmatota archaeon]